MIPVIRQIPTRNKPHDVRLRASMTVTNSSKTFSLGPPSAMTELIRVSLPEKMTAQSHEPTGASNIAYFHFMDNS